MVFDVFHQHLKLGLKFLTVLFETSEFPQKHFGLAMFLDSLERDAFELFIALFDQVRVKDGFLDMRVDVEFCFNLFE